MAPSMKFWDDWVDPEDMQAMWARTDVHDEWIAAGETVGKKVHISRGPDGQPYITPTELQGIVEIVVDRYFGNKLDIAMICAIVEIESERRPLKHEVDQKSKEASIGLMQMQRAKVDWLSTHVGYRAYYVDWTSTLLYKPFTSIYFGAAYLEWLSTCDRKRRNEEFVVRAYKSGPKDAMTKSSQKYWNEYLAAKQSLPIKWELPIPKVPESEYLEQNKVVQRSKKHAAYKYCYWEDMADSKDLSDMRKYPEVKREWNKASGLYGKVRFLHDEKMRPLLRKVELKAVAQIIVKRYFIERRLNSAMLCAIAEATSNRLLYGSDSNLGIMRVPFATASWLYTKLGYKSYQVEHPEDLLRPFVSMYFGAAYVCWLSNYDGRIRSDQFIILAYQKGPEADEDVEARTFWVKYTETLPEYLSIQKINKSCCIQ